MLFENPYFKVLSEEKYYKFQFKDGLKDKTISNYQFFSMAPAIKPEYKENETEKEFILSYLKAAEIISNVCVVNSTVIKMVVYDYSLALPAIFCCRQAVELVLKRVMKEFKVDYKYNHNIAELWSCLKLELNNHELSKNDSIVIDRMNNYIDIICFFDNEKSTALRYPDAKNGVQNHEKILLVNLKQIVSTTRDFVNHFLKIKKKN